jgi:site-specific recombinase XerD
MKTLGITTPAELRQADHKAVIAWERVMRETERAAASTTRRRLAALSSLYKHLVRHGHAARNPVGEVERPAINRDEGSTLAFSKTQARKVLDAAAEDTIAGRKPTGIVTRARRSSMIAAVTTRRRQPASSPRIRASSCVTNGMLHNLTPRASARAS